MRTRTATSKASKRETELAAEIRAMQKLAKDAAGKNYGAAVAALSKVSALRTELAHLREERAAEAEDDPLVRVRRLRRLATEGGSYTAAANLSQQETDIILAREQAGNAAKGDGFEGASDDEVLAVVEAAILALPDGMVLRIRDCAQHRLDGKKLRVVGGS